MFKPVSPKVDFPSQEKEMLDMWYSQGIVDKYLHRNDHAKKRFSFFDGPITANNPMGVHHAWGRTYKDVWQRFWNMRGYKERFQNGFDCQGLWVEVEVEKELGIKNKKDIENLVAGNKKESIAKFVELCKQRVLKFSVIQTEQSKRLGYFMDWDNSYYTMSDENNYMIWHFLKICNEKGWIFKGRDSVPWCPRCETAISQHEMLTEDYKELTHETVFVKLPITTKGWENTSLLVWTTTPWTVPANIAVGVNRKYTYGIWENEKTKEKILFIDKDESGVKPKRTVKAKDIDVHEYLLQNLEHRWKKVKDIQGKTLIGLRYTAPFDALPLVKKAMEHNPETFHTVVDGSDIVVANEGTGLLHVAPGAGKEDFDLGKKENLAVISPIKEDASYVNGMGEFSGKNAKKHPESIIDYLKIFQDGRYLLKSMPYTHRYPACWRCKTELVWRVTDEWYIAMDRKDNTGKTYREQMIETAKQIRWMPGFGLDRELDWLSNMHDWLISKKNRYWGLALPIYECRKCGKFTLIGSKDELHEKAVEGWDLFQNHTPHKPYIDEVKIACPHCKESVSRIDDVGNVWLDAGIIPFSTLVDPVSKKVSYTDDQEFWKKWFPADFITESFPGQFKNWFYALIAMSTALEKKTPFKNLLGYALVRDEKGEEMHKSKGNSVEFNEAADKFGVDVMRWLYARHDPEHNVNFGMHVADEVRRQFHLMVWNIYNFFLSNAIIDNWKPARKRLDERKNVLDRWIFTRLQQTMQSVTENLETWKADQACLSIEGFVNDVSLWYVRRSRERIGIAAENNDDKNECYETLYALLVTLSQLLAPMTPFMADAIYMNLTGKPSVHLSDWPLFDIALVRRNEMLVEQMGFIRKIVELGHGKRKELQIKVRQPLARITVFPGKDQRKFPESLDYLILNELNIKHIAFQKDDNLETKIELDTQLSTELVDEGQARDIIRMIQEERKKLGTRLDEKVDVIVRQYPDSFESEIKRKALIRTLTRGNSFVVKRL